MDHIVRTFKHTPDEPVNGFKTALACALSGAVDEEVIDDVIALVQDPSHGEHRIALLSALAESRSQKALEALEGALADPQLSKSAKLLMRVLRQRQRRKD